MKWHKSLSQTSQIIWMKNVPWSSHAGLTVVCVLYEQQEEHLNASRQAPGHRRSGDPAAGRPSAAPLCLWLRCRGCLCTEEMDTGDARIWSPTDPISWVCEWRQNRTLNLNFKKVGAAEWATKQGWSSSSVCERGRVCYCGCPGLKTAVSRGGDWAPKSKNLSYLSRLSKRPGVFMGETKGKCLKQPLACS